MRPVNKYPHEQIRQNRCCTAFFLNCLLWAFSASAHAVDWGLVALDLGLQSGSTSAQSQLRLLGRSPLSPESRMILEGAVRWNNFDQGGGSLGYQFSFGHAFDLARNVRVVPSLGYETFVADARSHWLFLRNTVEVELRDYIFTLLPMIALNSYEGERAATFSVNFARIFRGSSGQGSDRLGAQIEMYELLSQNGRKSVVSTTVQFGRSF